MSSNHHLPFAVVAALVLITVGSLPAAAQDLGVLLSPGPLSAAHADLEGLQKCESCHEPGQGVSARKCLSCHKPIADRIATKKGVHRDVTDDCTPCHAEHAGRDADIRPLDPSDFDHLAETEFPLDGKHAELTDNCAKCHTTRSYLTLTPECSSCHNDPHRGALGAACATCHTTSVAFKDSGRSFDHSSAAFQLDGAHATVDCVQCHTNGVYRGLRFAECSDCHTDPHRGAMGAVCTTCHTPVAWQAAAFDHDSTPFRLDGRHASVPCEQCHLSASGPVKRPPHQRCADCHNDPHDGTFSADCAACHTVNGFIGAPFDHAARTDFALVDRHSEIPCVACHKVPTDRAGEFVRDLDFRGLSTACASCHRDPHAGELGTACASCHGFASFRISSFEHPSSPDFFRGKHATAECSKCHTPLLDPARLDSMVSSPTYRGLSKQCSSCHTDPHLGQLGTDCATCHAVDEIGFQASRFEHDATDFALTGQHAEIDCETCHRRSTGTFPSGQGTAVRFTGMSDACVTCHEDRHAGELGTACQSCHDTSSFTVASYTHHSDPEFFLGEHADFACAECHVALETAASIDNQRTLIFSDVSTADCATCHEDVHKGTLGPDCASCHTNFAPFASASRDFHKDALLPLEGRHLAVPCADCHWNGQIEGTPTRCYDCHWIRRQDDRYHTALGVDCEQCHRPIAWTAVMWDHAGATGVPLTGAHATLDCDSCHVGGRFDGSTPTDCVGCHLEDYRGTDDPDHVDAGFPTDCELCHSPTDGGWDRVRFAHSFFPLVGTHATLDCADCHDSGIYQGLPSDCVDCHNDDYQQTVNPDHTAAGFDTECETCHQGSDSSWNNGRYPHSIFPLVAAHEAQPCNACHSSNVFQGLPSECVDCHLDDYQGTDDPDHVAAGFPTDCELCHAVTSPTWDGATFDHSSFQLVGTHATLDCADCHDSGVYQGLPSDCVDCHLADYQGTDDPDHADAGFPTDCELCHNAASPTWDGAGFDHSTFQLVGTHATLDCADCHDSGVYQGLPSDCVDCHLADYRDTDDPDHADAGFPTDCELCHDAASPTWDGAGFDHSSFQLVGTHATLDCADCHDSGVYQGLPAECVDCHSDDYQQAVNPDHTAAGFDTACETCHRGSDTSWQEGDYPHSIYPLVAAHEAQPCNACHASNVFQGLPAECVDCHLDDYQNTDDPDHSDAGFPTDCELCHSATSPTWDGATFDHSTFQLVGTHATIDCDSCHSSGVYQGLPSDCVDCHLADYQGTDDPNHVAAGFPTDCELCHDAASPDWDDATFDHSSFVLQGAHTVLDCNQCHASGVYQGLPSDCVDCHLADYQGTDDPDHVAAGFPTDCELCHDAASPTWDDATFDHSSFELVGAHATLDCDQCHASGIYQGLPSDCVDCHLADYQQADDPDHVAAGFPTDCELCHRAADLSWNQGTFDHMWFPINSGDHRNFQCSECHPAGGNFAVFSCTTSCHPRSEVDDEHNDVQGYVYNSPACYSCHPDGQADFGRSRLVSSHAAR